MRGFCQLTIVGNLTRDPETKNLPSESTVTEFGIAINRKWRTQGGEDREETTFVEVAAFGKTGETIAQYCKKGSPLLVEGRLKFDSWEDKQGGGKRSKLSVICANFLLLGGNPQGDDRQEQQPQRQQAPARNGTQQRSATPSRQPASQQGNRRSSGRAPQENPIGDTPEFSEADIPF